MKVAQGDNDHKERDKDEVKHSDGKHKISLSWWKKLVMLWPVSRSVYT